MNKLIITIVLLLIETISALGDDQQRIVPPSPQAQQFMKYIDYPVNYSSGLPDTEIPVYIIQCGELTLPVSLTYHFSGLKPSEETGFVGLGWNLNYGGIISRTMKGYPDEKYWNQTIKNENDFTGSSNYMTEDTDYGYLYNIAIASKDVQYDIFTYTLPRQSGHFIFRRSSNEATFLKPVLLPYRPIKIQPYFTGSGFTTSFAYFDVTDEQGIRYRFGKSLSQSKDELESYELVGSPTGWQSGATGWLLTEIISADKADTISFEYEFVKESSYQSNWIEKKHRIFHGTYSDCLGGGSSPYIDSGNRTTSVSSYAYTTKRLKVIRFKGGELQFTYKSDYYPNSLLEKIELVDRKSSQAIRTITLNQSKFHSNSSLLNWDKLDSIRFYDNSLHKIKGYSFNYNTSVSFPRLDDTYTNETYSVDHWGYYNGALNNTLLPPLVLGPVDAQAYLSGTANRNPNASYAKAGILTQVVYPGGGTATFTYTGNKIGSDNVGGLCIDHIVLQTENEQIKKSFSYSNPVGVDFIRDVYYYSQSMTIASNNNVYAIYSSSSDMVTDINLNERPVIYTSVTEYVGDQAANAGRILHTYDSSVLTSYLSPDVIQFNLQCYPLTLVMGWNNLPKNYYQRYLKYGDLREKETIYYDSSGNIIKSLNKYYSNSTLDSFDGLQIQRQVTNNAGLPHKTCHFLFWTYTIDQIAQKLDSMVTMEYGSNHQDAMVVRESYNYNSYLLPVRAVTKESNQKVREKKYRYPSDINSGVYASMVAANMLNYPIEETTLKDNNITSSKLTTYKANGTGYVPDKVYSLEITSPLSSFTYFNGSTKDSHYGSSPELSFDNYDSYGNIRQVTGRNGIVTTYLWSYGYTYPVAKIENAYLSGVSNTGDEFVCSNFVTALGAATSQPTVESLLSQLFSALKLDRPTCWPTMYTYQPLVGMTSQMDLNGTTTYYQYDDFGRLQNTLNDDSNVLGHYLYHYYNEETTDGNVPSELSVSPTRLPYPENMPLLPSTYKIVSVTSNTSWEAVSSASWIYIKEGTDTGSGNGTIQVTAIGPNRSTVTRTGSVTVRTTDGTISRLILVTQLGGGGIILPGN